MLRRLLPAGGVIALGLIVLVMIVSDRFGEPRRGNGPVRKVYFADNISTAQRTLIERFNQLHAGSIEVVPVNLPFEKFSTNERKELLARSLRSKSDRIDVFAVDLIWVPRFSRWSEPLGKYFSGDELRDYLQPSLQSCMYESLLVAVPLYIDVGMMYYRRDLLSRLPDAAQWEEKLRTSVTWDEFIELRDRLGLEGKPFYVFQADAFEGLICNYFELLAGEKRNFFEGNTIDLASPEAHAALQRMVDFVHKSKISPAQVADFDEMRSYGYMLDNDAMFVRGWPNFIEAFRKTYADTAKLSTIGRAALPHLPGKEPVSVFGGWNLMISKNCIDKDAALTFVKFLQSEESQKILFLQGGYIPINAKVYDDQAFLDQHPDLLYYRHLLNHGFHRPALLEYTKISDIISHFVHLAVKKELTVDEALRRARVMIASNKVLIK